MKEKRLFKDYSVFLEENFCCKIQKLSVNASFGCPNRDGTIGMGGCVYCNNQSFTPKYCFAQDSIAIQLEKGKQFFSQKYPDMKYLAYFQSHTNTYAPLDILKNRYEEALRVADVEGLVIATRPDCISDELIEYLAWLSKKTFVLIEIGIETCDDEVLKMLNRGHTYMQVQRAVEKLAQSCVKVCGHIILGLPGDKPDRIVNEPVIISSLPLDILKLHQLQIIKGTKLAEMYEQNTGQLDDILYSTPKEYAEDVIKYIERLRSDLTVERFTSQSPDDMLLAPKWGMKNHEFVDLLKRIMIETSSYQGRKFEQRLCSLGSKVISI